MSVELKEAKRITNRKTKVKAPVTDVFQMFDIATFPYPSKISFLPLINYWRKKLDSSSRVDQLIAREIEQLLMAKGNHLLKPIEDLEQLDGLEDLMELLISKFRPYQDKDALIRMSGPFNTLPFYHTSSLDELLSHNSIQTDLDKDPEKVYRLIIYRAGCMILNRWYGQKLELDIPYIFTVKKDALNLEKHFKTKIDSRFLEVKKLKPLKRLSEEQIHELLSNVGDIDLWLKHLPPSNFEFQGVICTLLTETTETETLSRLKDKLLQKDALLSKGKILSLEKELCNYFRNPDLKLGVSTVDRLKVKSGNKKYGIKYSLLGNAYSKLLSSKYKGSIYEKVATTKNFVVIEDLPQYLNPTPLEIELLSKGINNILVAPLINKDRDVIGFIELGCPEAFQLNSLSALKLKGIISLFNVAIERSQADIDNQLEAIIRENFTSIHPSIEWAFVEKALHILKKDSNDLLDEDEFVFRDNYPLYAQADIVKSTLNRNKAIQADLIDNLYHIKKLLNLSNRQYSFPLADQISIEVDSHIDQLKRGISSNSEYTTMSFIRNEVHPILRYLKKKNPLIREAYYTYIACLDPQLGTVYNKRKDYEKSVAMINRMLSSFLDEQQILAQKMCPHYYEKFQTDGLSYNIYIGQSLMRKGKFKEYQLKNLRLWQLLGMCEITKKIAQLQNELPIPLTTAQLIFVHSTPLSIRFRLDEKRFDVDGAYNARYEIIKKRIDKAVIEGSNERLTVTGKVAIVYQQEKDRREYLRYIKYLTKKGYIEKNIEDLQLKKMQGVQGLKALRLTVRI